MALRRPSIKRIVIGVLVVVLPIVGVVLAFVGKIAINAKYYFVDPVYDSVRFEAQLYKAEVIADAQSAAWRELGIINVEGKDAGPYLNALVPWTRNAKTIAQGTLPDPATATDFSWMSRLHEFDTWDIDNFSVDARDTVFVRAMPDGKVLRQWAKRRIEVGDKNAKRDVEQLARLLIQTESFVLTRMGLKILRETFPERHDSIKVLERLSTAQIAWAFIANGTSIMDSAVDPALAPFQCAGLNEAMGLNLAFRPLLREEFANEYRRADRLLEETKGNCRLSFLRRAWSATNGAGELPDGPRAFCEATHEPRTGWCTLPDVLFVVPRVRATAGHVLAAIAVLDGFRAYRPPGFEFGQDPHQLLQTIVDNQTRLLEAASDDIDRATELETRKRLDEDLQLDRKNAAAKLEECGCRSTEQEKWTDVVCVAPEGTRSVTDKTLYCPSLALGAADVRFTRWKFDRASKTSELRFAVVRNPVASELFRSRLLPPIPDDGTFRDLERRGVDPAVLAVARENHERLKQQRDAIELAQLRRRNMVDIDVFVRAQDSHVSVRDVALEAMLAGSTALAETFEVETTDDPQQIVARCRPVAGQEEKLVKKARAIEGISVDMTPSDAGLTLRFTRDLRDAGF